MFALESSVKIMSAIGLVPYQSKGFLKLIKWLYFLVIIYNLLPQANFLITYRSNIIKVTRCLPVFIENFCLALKVIALIYNLEEIHILMRGVSGYFCSDIGGPKTLEERNAESRSVKVFRTYGIMIGGTWIFHVVVPIFTQLFQFILGRDTEDTYKELLNNVYFFDSSSAGVYYIMYITSSMTLTSVSYGIFAIDGFFCALCIHVIGALRCIQNDISRYEIIGQEDSLFIDEVTAKITRAHNFALRLHYQLEKCFSPIIFIQYFGSSFIICFCIFQSISVTHNLRTLLEFLSFSVAGIMQLLLYCWFGVYLTEEHLKVGELIYNLPWYNYPSRIAKELQMILRKCQKELFLKGLGFYNCNLAGFMNIINTSISAVAVLRSLKM